MGWLVARARGDGTGSERVDRLAVDASNRPVSGDVTVPVAIVVIAFAILGDIIEG